MQWKKINEITATNIQNSKDGTNMKIWYGTQAEYDSILIKDTNTIYFIGE